MRRHCRGRSVPGWRSVQTWCCSRSTPTSSTFRMSFNRSWRRETGEVESRVASQVLRPHANKVRCVLNKVLRLDRCCFSCLRGRPDRHIKPGACLWGLAVECGQGLSNSRGGKGLCELLLETWRKDLQGFLLGTKPTATGTT